MSKERLMSCGHSEADIEKMEAAGVNLAQLWALVQKYGPGLFTIVSTMIANGWNWQVVLADLAALFNQPNPPAPTPTT